MIKEGERSGSVVECLTRERRAAVSNLTGVTFQENRSSFLWVLFKRIPFCLELPVQHNHLLFERCWGHCFVVSGSALVAHFTRLCLKAVTEPNSAEPTKLTECSLFNLLIIGM